MASKTPALPTELLEEVISYFDTDLAELAKLVRVSRQFYKIAGPKLYRDIIFDLFPPSPFIGWDDTSRGDCSKAALLGRTTELLVETHRKASCAPMKDLRMPNVKILNLADPLPAQFGDFCTGLECEVICSMRPAHIILTCPWFHGSENHDLKPTPAILSLFSHAACVTILLGVGGVCFMKRTVNLIKTALLGLDRIDIHFSLQVIDHILHGIASSDRDFDGFRSSYSKLAAMIKKGKLNAHIVFHIDRDHDVDEVMSCDTTFDTEDLFWDEFIRFQSIWNDVRKSAKLTDDQASQVELVADEEPTCAIVCAMDKNMLSDKLNDKQIAAIREYAIKYNILSIVRGQFKYGDSEDE